MAKVVFELPARQSPPSDISGNTRAHPLKQHRVKAAFRDEVAVMFRQVWDGTPMARARIKYTSYWCGTPMDRTNFTAGMKALEDQLVREGLLVDDAPAFVLDNKINYVRVPHREDIKVVVEVEEILTERS